MAFYKQEGQLAETSGAFNECTNCQTSNDHDFRFCKLCGVERVSASTDTDRNKTISQETLDKINSRIAFLDSIMDSASYSKQKCSLKQELIKFLMQIKPQKTIMNALPEDIKKFLVFKEANGRTQMHSDKCTFRGSVGKQTCKCPVTLASKSVDSLIGKLRAIFRDEGRSGEWNPVFCTGNPASSIILKRHLKAVSLEQAASGVIKKQAVPLMFDKLGRLCRYLSYKISVEKDNTTKFLLLRDRAYFSLLCHSGDRASDLGLVKSERIFDLPRSQGIFISETAGKTASLNSPKSYIVMISKDQDICPVKFLKQYIEFSSNIGIDLRNGYIFKVRDNKSKLIVDKPVSSSSMSERLKTHLMSISMYQGESGHSMRRGCAITLKMLGVTDASINQHIGWGCQAMLEHYARIGTLCGPNSAANALSQAAAVGKCTKKSQLAEISSAYTSIGNLRRFYFD